MKLKKSILTLTGIVAIIPGIGLFKSTNILPDIGDMRGLFIAIGEIIFISSIVLTYQKREKILSFSNKRFKRVIIILIFTLGIFSAFYLRVYNFTYFIDQNQQEVFIPIKVSENLKSEFEIAKSRKSYVDEYSSNEVIIQLNDWENAGIWVDITFGILLLLYYLMGVLLVTLTIINVIRFNRFSLE